MGGGSDPHTLLRELLDSNLLSHDEVQTDTFTLEERIGRNSLVLISTRQRTLTHKTFSSSMSYLRESTALDSLAHTRLGRHAPRLLRREDHTILAETAPDLRLFGGNPHDPRIPAARTLRRAGELLATLHRTPVPAALPPATSAVDPHGGVGPWILNSPPAARQFVKALQDPSISGPFGQVVAELAELSKMDPVFSHGDLRPGNLLLDRTGQLWLIDWETAGPDARWRDVGALLATVVELAVCAGTGPPAPKVTQALIHAYCQRATLPPNTSLLVRCAGTRLLQAALERRYHEEPVTQHTQAIEAIGRLFLLRPAEGAIRLGLLLS